LFSFNILYFSSASFKEEENSAFETQPFPSLQRVSSEYRAIEMMIVEHGNMHFFSSSFAHVARDINFWV